MKSLGLMYHDVYEKAPFEYIPPSARMYHVSLETFRSHLEEVRASGMPALTVSGALGGLAEESVFLTFDDGWRGAFTAALSLLHQCDLKATFFVTRDFIGRPGFCDPDLIAAAARLGMEIGVHGTSHRMLAGCTREEIFSEFRNCKEYLESILNRPVTTASMPGGDWTPATAECAQAAGLSSLCTSSPRVFRLGESPFKIGRMAIRNETSAGDIRRYCSHRLRRERVRWMILQAPRRLLGTRNYTVLRRRLLGDSKADGCELFRP